MSQYFRGKEGLVRFSNEAVEHLFRAWVTLGNDIVKTDEQRGVVRWLRDRLQDGAPGDRAFLLDPLPDELSSQPRRVFLARLIADVAADICQEQPMALQDITWSDELRISWLARLMDLHALVIDALPTDLRPAPLDRQSPIPSSLRAECATERLLLRLDELLPPRRKEPAARLAVIDEILSTIQSHGLEPVKRTLLARLYSNQADAFLEKKNIRSAIKSLRSSASFESDAAIREATLEHATALEHELDGSA